MSSQMINMFRDFERGEEKRGNRYSEKHVMIHGKKIVV